MNLRIWRYRNPYYYYYYYYYYCYYLYSHFWGVNFRFYLLYQVLNCDFDDSTFCAWANEKNRKFKWTLKSGQTPSRSTGPLSDVSGINSLFYIDSLVRFI